MTENRCINCMRKLTNDNGACPHCGFDPGKYKPPEQTLPPGTTLNNGKYIIGRILGRGGFGVTYVALDTTLELRVAIKECLPRNCAWRNPSDKAVQWGLSVPEQEAMLESFVKEARKMAKIDEIPGVIQVREYFYDNETAYIVMNYVEGETLARRLRRNGPMSAEACFRILAPVMDSLAEAHQCGLIHRDISPNNIMIARKAGGGEKVWLLDLGAAKDLGTRISAPNVSANTQIVGTPGYTPLEQYSPDGKIGSWTDVHAMSATFFYCMTGQKPPSSTTRALESQMPEVLYAVSGPVGETLRKGLALRPEERYQSMTELRDALEAAIEETARTREYVESQTEVLVKVSPPEPPQPETPEPQPEPLQPETLEPVAETPEPESPEPETPESEPEPLQPETPEPVAEPPQPETPKAQTKLPQPEAVTPPPEKPKAERKTHGKKPIKKKRNIIIGIVLAVTLLLAFLFKPQIKRGLLQVMPAGGKCGTNVSWTLNKDGLMTISGTGDMRYYGKYPWKDYQNIITKVNISSGVTNIEDLAFLDYVNLASVEIPDSVTEIGFMAFWGCLNLSDIEIPDSVTKIDSSAFSACALTSVVIPDGVTEIENNTFSHCKQLTSVVIPDSVTRIGKNAFAGCSSLESVSIPAGAEIDSSSFDEGTTVRRTEISSNENNGDEPEKTWALSQKEPEELWGVTP